MTSFHDSAQPHKRAYVHNTPNRFEREHVEIDEEALAFWEPDERVQVIEDSSQSILTRNESPDLRFEYSLNPYRGCEHGCAYCYARPTHEFLGYSAGLDFERRIHIKADAPKLLKDALSKRNWQAQPIFMSGVTDCYQPLEARYELTRRCLEVLSRYRNPVVIVTKNPLVLRDKDILTDMALWGGVQVWLSVTTLDQDLAEKMEPRTGTPRQRLAALRKLHEAGVPTGVMVAPVIPGLTDTEMPAILKAAASVGVDSAAFTVLRLPHAVKNLFAQWLGRCVPSKKARVLERLMQLRDGNLNDSRFGERFTGKGVWARQYAQLFRIIAEQSGINKKDVELACHHFRPPGGTQLELF